MGDKFNQGASKGKPNSANAQIATLRNIWGRIQNPRVNYTRQRKTTGLSKLTTYKGSAAKIPAWASGTKRGR